MPSFVRLARQPQNYPGIFIGFLACSLSLVTNFMAPCHAQSRTGSLAVSGSPLATCEAGNYLLEVWCVKDCRPDRSTMDIALFMNIAENMNEPETFREKQMGPQGGGMGEGTSITGGGGTGGGGSFEQPKKVFGIRVLDKKSRKIVKDAIFSAGYSIVESDDSKAESTLPESFRARYLWPSSPQESKNEIPMEELTPLPFFMNDPSENSVKSVQGVLVIPKEESARVAFTPADIKNKARKSAGKFAVQIDSVQKKNNKIELNLLVTLPPKPAVNPGNFQDFIKQSQMAFMTRVNTYVEDSAGGIHFGSPQSRGGGGGGGGSSFSFNGSNAKPKRGSTQKNNDPPQKFPFLMSPTPEGTTTKELVVEVHQAKDAPEVVPFEFGKIEW